MRVLLCIARARVSTEYLRISIVARRVWIGVYTQPSLGLPSGRDSRGSESRSPHSLCYVMLCRQSASRRARDGCARRRPAARSRYAAPPVQTTAGIRDATNACQFTRRDAFSGFEAVAGTYRRRPAHGTRAQTTTPAHTAAARKIGSKPGALPETLWGGKHPPLFGKEN